MRPRLSLRGRGVQILAQREHSRTELRRKLLAYAITMQEGQGEAAPTASEASQPADPPGAVEAVLDWLQSHGYLSDERFAESRIHARATKFGNLRIRQELAQHGLALTAEAALALKSGELERARDVWQRKFGALPASLSERARQVRFLAGRGFSSEVIRRVVGGAGDD